MRTLWGSVMRTLWGCTDFMLVVQEGYSCALHITWRLFLSGRHHLCLILSSCSAHKSTDELRRQLKSSCLSHSFPAPVTSYAVPIIILTSWTASFYTYDAFLLGFYSLLHTINLSNVIESDVSVILGYDIVPLSIWFLTFWGNIVIWSLGVRISKKMSHYVVLEHGKPNFQWHISYPTRTYALSALLQKPKRFYGILTRFIQVLAKNDFTVVTVVL